MYTILGFVLGLKPLRDSSTAVETDDFGRAALPRRLETIDPVVSLVGFGAAEALGVGASFGLAPADKGPNLRGCLRGR